MTGPVGSLRPVGRLVDASNGTFLMLDEQGTRWVYKPVAGEAPLSDFPPETLGRREVAAYAVSEALGLGIVPPTLWGEGPFGEGSVQLWVDGAPSELIALLPPEQLGQRWLPILLAEDAAGAPIVLAHRDDERLRLVALFDALLNSADRKAGHLIAAEDRLFGVDHGLCLHAEPKLRTVLWGWAGDPLTDPERALVAKARELSMPLAPGLADEEWAALVDRAEWLLAEGVFPSPAGHWRDIPWPPL